MASGAGWEWRCMREPPITGSAVRPRWCTGTGYSVIEGWVEKQGGPLRSLSRPSINVLPVGLCAVLLGVSGPVHADQQSVLKTQGPASSVIELPVPLIGQETGYWCWAASGQMTMTYLGG